MKTSRLGVFYYETVSITVGVNFSPPHSRFQRGLLDTSLSVRNLCFVKIVVGHVALQYFLHFWESKSWLKIESKQPTWKLAEKSLFVDKMDVLLRIDEMDVSHIDKKEDIEAIINQRISINNFK